MKRLFRLSCAVMAVLVLPMSASAATMTFGNLSDGSDLVAVYEYREDGIIAESETGLQRWGGTGLHLDDSGTGLASSVRFRMALPFVPISLGIDALDTHSYREHIGGEVWTPYDNVLVRGYRNGREVYQDRFFMGPDGFSWTYYFPDMEPLTALTVDATLPQEGSGVICLDWPCAHFDVRSVTLAPIPLPPSALLLLGAWILPLAFRYRRTVA